MSSGSRNESLEALLVAKYELECCEEGEKEDRLKTFDGLLAPILPNHSDVSRSDIVEAIGVAYRTYKAARIRAQRRRETI